jgi:drug/metabolite transporter (DMT)-like permease
MYFHLLNNIGVSKSLTVAYLVPLFAMFWGTLILDEPITQSMVFGCGLILSGTAIAIYQ